MSEEKSVINILNNGGVVVVPTDTLHALCVDAMNESAVRNIYNIKQRDHTKSLPVFYASLEAVEKDFEMDAISKKICLEFWPGQLSVVLKKRKNCTLAKSINIQDETILVRIPNNKFILDIIKKLGKPITATSANISGSNKLMSADKVDYLIQSEIANQSSLPSTIVSCISGDLEVIREGIIPKNEITAFVRKGNIS